MLIAGDESILKGTHPKISKLILAEMLFNLLAACCSTFKHYYLLWFRTLNTNHELMQRCDGPDVTTFTRDSGADSDAVSAKSDCFLGLYIPSGL